MYSPIHSERQQVTTKTTTMATTLLSHWSSCSTRRRTTSHFKTTTTAAIHRAPATKVLVLNTGSIQRDTLPSLHSSALGDSTPHRSVANLSGSEFVYRKKIR